MTSLSAPGRFLSEESLVTAKIIAFSVGAVSALTWAGGAAAAPARADALGYLVNVTTRPGYNFASADDALAYGRGICDDVEHGRAYADLVSRVKTTFENPDEYHATYLITQAVNELCPAQIWQLRNSAAR